jgi:hypothetical protein
MKESNNVTKARLRMMNLEQLEQTVEVVVRKGWEWLFQASVLEYSQNEESGANACFFLSVKF